MSSLTAVWRSPWLAPFNDAHALNDLLAQVNPLWSLDQIKAKLLTVRNETADVRSFVFRTNRRWPGHRAGQHVVLELEINGVRRHRSFSIASVPDSRTIEITVKRQASGLVTSWMHESLLPGTIVGLSAPRGRFVLPDSVPGKLLMLAAGSGITPLMSQLRDLHAQGEHADVCLVYLCRNEADVIFRTELEHLARRWPSLRLKYWFSEPQGRLDMRSLEALVPDAAERLSFLCGPQSFMQAVLTYWEAQAWLAPLYESFGAPLRRSQQPGELLSVRAEKSEQVFTAEMGSSLLEQAEHAGLKPKYGCRIGICQTCKCVKRSGVVRNLLTGALSAEPNEHIQLCVSAAVSELSLEI